MCWSEFETLIQSVWDAAAIKNDVRSALGLGCDKSDIDPGTSQSKRQSYRHSPSTAIDAPPVRPPRPPTDIVDKFKDIVCVQCEKSFVPSSRQVEKFEMAKIPLPNRCPKCKGQVCDTFRDTGACPYGEYCKSLHYGETAEVKKHSYSCRFQE